MPKSLKIRLMKLPLTKKLVLIGSGIALISVFLPWYSDIDRFKTGDTFLGIGGPLYLAGLLVLVASTISFGLIVLQLMEKPMPKLPVSENKLYIFNGGISVFMLVLAASVYFHSKFGVNLVDKSAGIGMIFGFIGSGLEIAGGFLNTRVKEVNFDEEGHLEPLIRVDDREQADINVKRDTPIKESNTKAWDYVQDSINNYNSDDKD